MKAELPDLEARDIPYSCWCGYKGTYDQREAHLEMHKREKKAQRMEKE